MLRFRLFGFPVMIQPGFWFLALLLGYHPDRSAAAMALWVAVVLVSVLIHELGHAMAARAYGQSPVIALHMMGGLTSWRPTHELGKKRRILVTFAGPAAGFVLGGLAYVVLVALDARGQDSSLLVETIELLCVANLFWSSINLLPVLPFDGGQILAAALGPERRMLSATLSMAFGLIVALVLYRMGSLFGAVLFGVGGVSSYFAARRSAPAPISPEALGELVHRARRALDAEEYETAEQIARAVAHTAPPLRPQAFEIAAWAALGRGNVAAARGALKELPNADRYLAAAVSHADGDLDRARALLIAAEEQGDTRHQLTALRVRVELERGDAAAAAALALELDATEGDLRVVAERALEAGASLEAARLYSKIFEQSSNPEDAFAAARSFAQADARDDAVAALSQAVGAGLVDPERARADLTSLLGHDGFEAALMKPPR